jgi:hypothetical protein
LLDSFIEKWRKNDAWQPTSDKRDLIAMLSETSAAPARLLALGGFQVCQLSGLDFPGLRRDAEKPMATATFSDSQNGTPLAAPVLWGCLESSIQGGTI